MPKPTAKQWAKAQANGGKFTRSENQDRDALIKWLDLVYPNVLYKVDFAGETDLPPQTAKRLKSLTWARGWPDLMIYEPREGFVGLALELKAEDAILYKTNGLFVTDHLQEQKDMLDRLIARGWKGHFVKGLVKTIKVIEEYLQLPRN